MNDANDKKFQEINDRIDLMEKTILELAQTAAMQAELGQKTVRLLQDIINKGS